MERLQWNQPENFGPIHVVGHVVRWVNTTKLSVLHNKPANISQSSAIYWTNRTQPEGTLPLDRPCCGH